MSDTQSTNRASLEVYLGLVAGGDVEALSSYWHADIVFEAPFSFTGLPSRTVGKAAVRDRLTTSYGLVTMAFTVTEIYELADPDRIFVEYTSDGYMLGSGARYQNSYITLFEFRDGLIVTFREFYDSQRCAAAFGPLLNPDH